MIGRSEGGQQIAKNRQGEIDIQSLQYTALRNSSRF